MVSSQMLCLVIFSPQLSQNSHQNPLTLLLFLGKYENNHSFLNQLEGKKTLSDQ
ncbi:hypothetical protein MtrunA17_Chr8g0334991 [Medicago truncatula]|uniref:Uncharacterized protein n=1 Tax=Medicago truncatula TaxID=3880 RepID=A0A396G9Y4_MEDTR|nr:hypothetical protein MtrunA17_Chr8g0334991 [Medicago truncatula]